jgi:hypothetical protein
MIKLKRASVGFKTGPIEGIVASTVIEDEIDFEDDFDDEDINDDEYYTDDEFDYDDEEEEITPTILDEVAVVVTETPTKNIKLVDAINLQVSLLEDGLNNLNYNDIDDNYNISLVIKNLKGILSLVNA